LYSDNKAARLSGLILFVMFLSFVSSRVAANGVSYNLMFDKGFNQYAVCNQAGVTLFKAESESLAAYGIRLIGKVDVFGLLLTEEGFKHYCGKPYIQA